MADVGSVGRRTKVAFLKSAEEPRCGLDVVIHLTQELRQYGSSDQGAPERSWLSRLDMVEGSV